MTWQPPIKVISIPGHPVPKLRPRVTKSGRAYTPSRTKEWEQMAAQCIALEWGNTPKVERPIQLVIAAVFSRPKKRPAKVTKEAWESGLRIWRPAKPDLDNLVKAVLDAAQMSGVLVDDYYVVDLAARKLYASKYDDGPKVLLSFVEVD